MKRQQIAASMLALIGILVLTGCASQPTKIAAQDVSPLLYKDYDCDQLVAESHRISRRVHTLHAQLKSTADADAAQMGIGLVLFWPTLLFLEGGDGPEAQEYARLKGERDAIETVSIQKKCGIEFKPLIPKDKPEGS